MAAKRFNRDAAFWILRKVRVHDRIGNKIAEFVRMHRRYELARTGMLHRDWGYELTRAILRSPLYDGASQDHLARFRVKKIQVKVHSGPFVIAEQIHCQDNSSDAELRLLKDVKRDCQNQPEHLETG